MLLFIGSLGAPEILLILGLAFLIFGPKKLPEIGRTLGKGLREFKRGTSDILDAVNPVTPPPNPTPKPQAKAPAQINAPPVDSPPSIEDVEEVVIDVETEPAPQAKPKAETGPKA